MEKIFLCALVKFSSLYRLFQVRNMFCVGSPLAVFLIMRGSTTFVPETDSLKRIYNIFHPYDPVVYF